MTLIKLIIISLFLFMGVLSGFRYIVVPHVVRNHHVAIDFNNIQFPKSPNFYYSSAKNSVFNVSISTLEKHWDVMISKQPRVTLLMSQKNGKRRVYVQLSTFWHFPDFIDVKFIALNSKQSSLEIYSRSYFGYSDLGVNKKRVEQWILALSNEISE